MSQLPPPGPAPLEPVAPVVHTEIPAVPARRSRLRLGLIIGGAVLVALLAGAGITYAVVASQRTPEATVSAFLDELVAGDAAGAQRLLTSIPSGNPVLLQPDTYEATPDTISGYTVLDSSTDGATSTVTVEFEQAGETYTQGLSLSLVRRDLGVFDVWRVDGSNLPSVYVSYARPDGMELSVNGTDFGLMLGAFDLDIPALPGSYTFEPVGATDYYSAEPVSITLRFDGPDSSTTALLEVLLTEAGTASAQAAVNAHLDGCLAQPVLAPGPNCGFGVIQDDATYSNIRWTLLTRPTVTFGAFRPDSGWAVIPASPGSLRFDADYETSSEYGTAESSFNALEQAGVIVSIDENGVAVFESVEYTQQ